MGRVAYVPSLLCAEFTISRVCHVPSLLCAKLSINPQDIHLANSYIRIRTRIS